MKKEKTKAELQKEIYDFDSKKKKMITKIMGKLAIKKEESKKIYDKLRNIPK